LTSRVGPDWRIVSCVAARAGSDSLSCLLGIRLPGISGDRVEVGDCVRVREGLQSSPDRPPRESMGRVPMSSRCFTNRSLGKCRSRKQSRARCWVALAMAAGFACASPPPPRTLVLSVSNQLGRPIAEIWQKDCDEADSGLVELENSTLQPGEERGFVLPPTCVDVLAFDERGRLVGQQRELHMLPGARWVLRR
jgi:hypothetical protein